MSDAKSKGGEFVTLDHFSGEPDICRYFTGVSDANPEAGYIHIDRYPYYRGASNSDYVPLHRLTAVAEYGIEAVADSVVHHKNGVRFDNRPENLELMSNAEHSRLESNNTPLRQRLVEHDDRQVKRALSLAGYSNAAAEIEVALE